MSIFTIFTRARRRRQTARDLKSLPPALLRDIGIEPDRIDEAASGLVAQMERPPVTRRTAPQAPATIAPAAAPCGARA